MCQAPLGACFSRAVRRQQSPKEGPTVVKSRSEKGERTKDAVLTPRLERGQACTLSSPQLFLAALSGERGLLLLAEMGLFLAPAEGKAPKRAPLAGFREVFAVQGWGKLKHVVANDTRPLPRSRRCCFGQRWYPGGSSLRLKALGFEILKET